MLLKLHYQFILHFLKVSLILALYYYLSSMSLSMSRLILILALLHLFNASDLHANHLTGGEMSYSHVRNLTDGRQVYKVTLNIYRDALSGGADFDNPLSLSLCV